MVKMFVGPTDPTDPTDPADFLNNNEDSLVPFPLACWQDFVFGDEEEQRLQVLKELHVLWNFSDAKGAEDRV